MYFVWECVSLAERDIYTKHFLKKVSFVDIKFGLVLNLKDILVKAKDPRSQDQCEDL